MSTAELDLIISISQAFLLITHLLIFVAEGLDGGGGIRRVLRDQVQGGAI